MEIVWVAVTSVGVVPTWILHLKSTGVLPAVCSARSLAEGIVSVAVWEVPLCVPAASFSVKSAAVVVAGYSHATLIAAGMSTRLQVITWSSVANTSALAVAILAPEDCLDCFLELALDSRNKSNSNHQTFLLLSYNFHISNWNKYHRSISHLI